jgi:mono/diheme cytochrome c family protein
MRGIFAVSSVLLLAVLSISPVKDYLREWKRYERAYVRFAQTHPDTKRLLADFQPGIRQIWLPDMGVVDRCTTCHQGISEPSLRDPSVPQPFRAHPPVHHAVENWGCVICHGGQGRATEVAEAHKTTLAWERPLLPVAFVQASCGSCHRANLPETPRLNRGRELLTRLNCSGCHRLEGIERSAMLGPALTNIGTKVSREWLFKWLKAPQTLTDPSGNVTVNGYAMEASVRMPKFRLTDSELRALSGYLSSLGGKAVRPYAFDPRMVAAWKSRPDLIDRGEQRFREMFCSTCHSLAVTRGGETQLIGGTIGPELSKVGSKVNPNWLAAWLENPQSYLPHAEMPRYRWSEDDLYTVTQYMLAKLTDPDLLTDVPKLGAPSSTEIQTGQRLFVDKGCVSCHLVEGVARQQDFGPNLSTFGTKTVSDLSFGDAHIPHTVAAYVEAKIAEPLSVNPAARMPPFRLTQADLDALTTALLSMTGEPSTFGLTQLVVRAKPATFEPGGTFGTLNARYKCDACHKFNGVGGTLAPDLSYEGSRTQRQWLIAFLKNPQTLRPTLTLRMPQFNVTDQEAAALADYLDTVMQSPAIDQSSVDAGTLTPEQANLGKELYEVKYQCQACHTIGSSGGYVGPALTNAGNRLNAAWIEAWLKNPEAVMPGAIEPRRSFTEDEITALTAYLLTLKESGRPVAVARVRQ